jgi:tetratricopeptide (TPR) repeat protein
VRAALCLVLVASMARAQFRAWNDFPESPKPATSVSFSGLDRGAQNPMALAPLIEVPALQERYAEAAQHLSARAYSRPLGLRQQLASDFPQVPQIYSARCRANVGLAQWNLALIDCQYALQLRPHSPTAVYGLAQAQERGGLLLEAAQNYRTGRIVCSSVPNGLCTLNSDGTLACP